MQTETDPIVFRLNREVQRLQQENQMYARRLSDSVNAQAIIEGSIIKALEEIPVMVRNYLARVIETAMKQAALATATEQATVPQSMTRPIIPETEEADVSNGD